MTDSEIDALVATHIMGLEIRWLQRSWPNGDKHPFVVAPTTDDQSPCPHFSTDIAAAWEVVKKLRDLWTQTTDGVDGLDDSFPRPFDDAVFFESLHRNADRRWPWALLYVTPMAICLAALRAVGVEVPQ